MTATLIRKVHHVAYRCKDAKQTVEWYGKYLGMKFILAIAEDAVPSTGEADPYMHVFLDAGGGNILAFFELPTRPEMGRDPNTPAWTQHLALEVGSMEELLAAKAGSKPTASRWSVRPTTRCSSRSTSSIPAAIASNWPSTPTRRK
jgi:catechol 2,3-dioxygenase-like lactoylglutathione lyase family enzyme